MTAPTLAGLLDGVLAAGPPTASAVGCAHDHDLVDELRAQLEHAAESAVTGVDETLLPMRAPKDRIAKVLACEQHLVATSSAGEERSDLSESMVRGRVLDRLLHHHVHGGGAGRGAGAALAIAEGAFEAERDDEVIAWLGARADARERLDEDAAAFAERLDGLGPIDAAWWPRCEERLRVDLAGGRLVCSAQLDLVVGGRGTDRPMVIVEAKSGQFGQDHRDGLFWYALLAALRHGTPPAAVIGWSAWDGAGWSQPVSDALLRGAAQRAVTAFERLGDLARGRTPVRTACRACRWCPEQTTCDVAVLDALDGDDDGDGDIDDR
ncbi:MAG: hypothetical protein QOI47_344 [Actinomycetota bacterium]|nr:hypothetical protein [Actinomycetota bacterium]